MSPYKEKSQNAAYQREWQRRQRSKKKEPAADASQLDGNQESLNLNQTLPAPAEVSLRKAEDLLSVLELAMGEVLACKSDAIARARTIGYLVERASGLLRITELAEQVLELQKKVNEGGAPKDWKDASY